MSKETLKHYVEFRFPGVMFSESSAQPISERDPSKVQAPRDAFAYSFFDRQEYTAQDGEILVGAPRNRSGTYYFGKAMTLQDVRREIPNSDALQDNMKYNGWKKVVRTRRGNFQPLKEDDVILAER